MKLFKIYLKRKWWFGLTWAIAVVFMAKGYVYPKLRFEFDFIFEVETYILLAFYYIMWTIGWYFLFWKRNYLHQQLKKKESGA